jgi:hypothetical protein
MSQYSVDPFHRSLLSSGQSHRRNAASLLRSDGVAGENCVRSRTSRSRHYSAERDHGFRGPSRRRERSASHIRYTTERSAGPGSASDERCVSVSPIPRPHSLRTIGGYANSQKWPGAVSAAGLDIPQRWPSTWRTTIAGATRARPVRRARGRPALPPDDPCGASPGRPRAWAVACTAGGVMSVTVPSRDAQSRQRRD